MPLVDACQLAGSQLSFSDLEAEPGRAAINLPSPWRRAVRWRSATLPAPHQIEPTIGHLGLWPIIRVATSTSPLDWCRDMAEELACVANDTASGSD